MAELIRLSHYDPRWRQEFEQTRSSILQSCEGWVTDVWHVGSTAVPGIVAQPVIDCVAIVSDPDGWEIAATCIEGLNYSVFGTPVWLGGSDFMQTGSECSSGGPIVLRKPRFGAMTHQVFLCAPGNRIAEKMVAFRDLLRGFPEEAVKFEERKVAIWKATGGSPCGYEASKPELFQQSPPKT